jgi:hypothetical protein
VVPPELNVTGSLKNVTPPWIVVVPFAVNWALVTAGSDWEVIATTNCA